MHRKTSNESSTATTFASKPVATDECPSPTRGSRRLKLWELEHKCHCPIIGVCFDLKRIRQIVGKVMQTSPRTTDFEIHTSAVRESACRSRLAELLQKELEQHYTLCIQRFKTAKTAEALAGLWQESLAITDVAGPLWATLTHPCCTPELTQKIYADIHMLQHQVGAGERADLAILRHLQQKNTQLDEAHKELQHKLTSMRQQHAREIEALKQQLTASREEGLRQEQAAARYFGELTVLREHAREKETPLALSRRAQQAESRCLALRAQLRELELQQTHLQTENEHLAASLARRPLAPPVTSPAITAMPAEDALTGRCVLCVGGRTGAAHHYRTLVERLGGRFIHHDGGLEESLGRLDGSIAAADAVICQAGCISHNAYWRVKAQCKRSGKPCLYLKTPSLSNFVRGLEHLTNQPPSPTLPEKSTP